MCDCGWMLRWGIAGWYPNPSLGIKLRNLLRIEGTISKSNLMKSFRAWILIAGILVAGLASNVAKGQDVRSDREITKANKQALKAELKEKTSSDNYIIKWKASLKRSANIRMNTVLHEKNFFKNAKLRWKLKRWSTIDLNPPNPIIEFFKGFFSRHWVALALFYVNAWLFRNCHY